MTDQDKRRYIPLKDRPSSDRPRERLWQIGAEKLSNAELLAILIRKGTEGRSAIHVAEELLGQAGSVQDLAQLTPSEIRKTKGMGHANTAAVAAALELSRRVHDPDRKEAGRLRSSEEVVAYFKRHYGTASPEKFVAFYINRGHILLGELEVSRGGSHAAVVNPQRIFKEALLCNAKAVILAHNHPGGDVHPSQQDIRLTRELQMAANIFHIPIVEHIIVTEGGWFSFEISGLLKEGK